MNLLKQEELQSGRHYWIMLNQYHDWKLGYIGEDHDSNLWLHLVGVTNPIEVKHLTQCKAVEIEPPESIKEPIPR